MNPDRNTLIDLIEYAVEYLEEKRNSHPLLKEKFTTKLLKAEKILYELKHQK